MTLREKIEDLVRGPAARCPSQNWTVYYDQGGWSYVGHPGGRYMMGEKSYMTPVIFGGLRGIVTDEQEIQDEIESVYEVIERDFQNDQYEGTEDGHE